MGGAPDDAPYGHDQWIGHVLMKKARRGDDLKPGDTDDPKVLHEALRNACDMLIGLMESTMESTDKKETP